MEPMPELFAASRREEIAHARPMPVFQKLRLGGDLSDGAHQVVLSGIRGQSPDVSDDAAWAEVRRRLALGRRLEARRTAATLERV